MKRLILIFLLGTLPLFGAEISEKNVRSLIEEVAEASNEKNAEKLANLLSENFLVVISIDTPEGTKKIEQRRQQNLKMLREFFALVQNYKYSEKIKSISISEDKSTSIATLSVTEEYELEGKEFKGTAKQKYYISRDPEGALLIDKVLVIPE